MCVRLMHACTGLDWTVCVPVERCCLPGRLTLGVRPSTSVKSVAKHGRPATSGRVPCGCKDSTFACGCLCMEAAGPMLFQRGPCCCPQRGPCCCPPKAFAEYCRAVPPCGSACCLLASRVMVTLVPLHAGSRGGQWVCYTTISTMTSGPAVADGGKACPLQQQPEVVVADGGKACLLWLPLLLPRLAMGPARLGSTWALGGLLVSPAMAPPSHCPVVGSCVAKPEYFLHQSACGRRSSTP
jgi:hypothetical protein